MKEDEAMITAWHFMADFYGAPLLRDGRRAPAVGEWLVHDGPIQICASGLHASLDPLNALKYAPGPWVARVECDEVEAREDDKFVCRRRKILWLADATPVLCWFARRCALDVAHLWGAPDEVVRYLRTGYESFREAARAAARAAAEDDAAWLATRDSARDAARTAARVAATAAIRAAARAARTAMSDAAWYPAIDAARAKQSRRLRRGLMTLAR